jgi:hypothetical protein
MRAIGAGLSASNPITSRCRDVIDAAAAASVAALHGDANPVLAEDITTVLAWLDERGTNVTTQRTRLVNQLPAVFSDLSPGGAPKDLTATIAAVLLAGIRPVGPVEAARKQLGRDLMVQIHQPDQRLKVLTAQIAEAVAATGSHLTEVDAYRADRLRAAVGTHTPDEPIPHGNGLCQLRRRRPGRGVQRRSSPSPAAARRPPTAQPCPAHRRGEPDTNARQCRTGRLPHQDRGRQNRQGSTALP